MKTVHIIFNAHIDPIWLWPWQSGLDEALATCRSACDRLDEHPDVIFTRGEAWVYDEIERIDPQLFGRIRGHVEAGRWEVIGGWWLQPDCNLPSGFAMERQIDLGKQYFQDRFGVFPRTAYNVDSFGHAATLPALLHAAGQDRYVMMRPQQSELPLSACLFRWRGYDDGPEVVTFRIVGGYNFGKGIDERPIRAAAEQLPEGVDHTMFFVGFGDHGGGPTERQIDWLRSHQDSFDGLQLQFSSPTRFFDAIWPQRESLPLVLGELQQHAIGCYSVYRPIKTGVRTAEHLLRQAELFCAREPSSSMPDASDQIHTSWKKVCFAHFHDTYGGTCLPSAYAQPLAQLGYARAVADDLLQEGLRRKLNDLPDDPMQRIVLYNASDLPFAGPTEFTPWLDWMEWRENWRLIDENGAPLPSQLVASEALLGNLANLLFDIEVPASGMRVLRIDHEGAASEPCGKCTATPEVLSAGNVSLTHLAISFDGGMHLDLPFLALYEDASDTWSHGLDRYAEEPTEVARWDKQKVIDVGPLMASWISTGLIGESRLNAEWRVYSGGFAELRLNVDWRERQKLLKLVQPAAGMLVSRTDGIMGGWLTRPLDRRELPIRDGTIFDLSATDTISRIGVAAPDVYAMDASPERLRFTLLRSAIMARHAPHDGCAPRRTFTDQGEHSFVFRYFAGQSVCPGLIDRHASQMQRPLIVADLTRGMPKRLSDVPMVIDPSLPAEAPTSPG